MNLETYFECPRCDRYLNGLQSLGRLECSYHPGDLEYIDKDGKDYWQYSCCKRRPARHLYDSMAVMLGGVMEVPHARVKGCTPCDHGNDFAPVAVADIAEYIADGSLEPSAWKRFDQESMYVHREARQ